MLGALDRQLGVATLLEDTPLPMEEGVVQVVLWLLPPRPLAVDLRGSYETASRGATGADPRSREERLGNFNDLEGTFKVPSPSRYVEGTFKVPSMTFKVLSVTLKVPSMDARPAHCAVLEFQKAA